MVCTKCAFDSGVINSCIMNQYQSGSLIERCKAMEYKRIECPSCGAPLSVNESLERITCSYCGTYLVVQHSESELTLKFARNVENGIKSVGEKMEGSIREGTDSTRIELKRLQAQQQLASLENRLIRINDEIRYLESGKDTIQTRSQLSSLNNDKQKIIRRITSIEEELYGTPIVAGTPENTRNQTKEKPRLKAGCLSGCLVYIVIGIILGGIGMGIDSVIFGSDIEQGPFFSVGVIIGIMAGIIAFFYKINPDSKMSIWIKEKTSNIFKKKSTKNN